VLDMSIEDAAEFFKPITSIHRYLATLVEVGLGYVRLGQPAPTLSGGEAAAREAVVRAAEASTGRTVYILDEPTTGLHFEDIRKLLGVINGLVDKGNSVIVIEHNMDVIKTSDWIVDMVPRAGQAAHRGRKGYARGCGRQSRQLHRALPSRDAGRAATEGAQAAEGQRLVVPAGRYREIPDGGAQPGR